MVFRTFPPTHIYWAAKHGPILIKESGKIFPFHGNVSIAFKYLAREWKGYWRNIAQSALQIRKVLQNFLHLWGRQRTFLYITRIHRSR